MQINEKVICVSKDGSRIGYKKTKPQRIINFDHKFTLLRPSNSQFVGSSNECSICFENLHEGFYTSRCGHKFHIQCIVPWFSKNVTCPECRCHDIEYPLSVDLKQTP